MESSLGIGTTFRNVRRKIDTSLADVGFNCFTFLLSLPRITALIVSILLLLTSFFLILFENRDGARIGKIFLGIGISTLFITIEQYRHLNNKYKRLYLNSGDPSLTNKQIAARELRSFLDSNPSFCFKYAKDVVRDILDGK